MDTMSVREIKKKEKQLIELISPYVGKKPNEIEVNASFRSMGISKRKILKIVEDIEKEFDKKISPTVFFEKSNIKMLTEYIFGIEDKHHNEPIRQIKYNKHEPIAVIGMACRFPGASNTEEYWNILKNGIDCISEVPKSRWNINDYYSPEYDDLGKMYSRHGGYIKDVYDFDAKLFGISKTEALQMDPQHRLLLEVCWEALENANYAPDSLENSNTGVYVGIHNRDYMHRNLYKTDGIDAYSISGGSTSMASGRISYHLGLIGPSMSIDTACSSSLVTVHLACQSLRVGECDMAIAGGVNLILSPEFNIGLSKARMLSKTGKCHTFDASADGYARSEGCGIVILKRLSEAIADNNSILGIIRGSALKQDGRSNGITAPNKVSQERVIKEALFNADLKPSDVQVVEAHGTGTELGDPIELEALKSVFCEDRDFDKPLIVGSVKTNIGHTETAAGIAAIIKSILMLQHKVIPAHLNFKNPNPHFDFENTPIRIPTKTEVWNKDSQPRVIGVSAFGFSGTNAHIVLEEAPDVENDSINVKKSSYLLTLSSASKKALKDNAMEYAKYFEANPGTNLGDFCYTANTARANLSYRTAFVGENCEEISKKLYKFYNDDDNKQMHRVIGGRQPEVVFMFTGQESVYLGIAKELYLTQEVFRDAINRCSKKLDEISAFKEHCLLKVIECKEVNEDLLKDTSYVQPLIFSIQYALVELYKSWGIEPSIVLGHSAGEYAAACTAGIMKWDEGLELITERGRILKSISGKGSMIIVFRSEQELRDIISFNKLNVDVAVINGAKNIVLSGEVKEIDNLCDILTASGIEYRMLSDSNGFHSYLVDSVIDEFEKYTSKFELNRPIIDYISSIDGEIFNIEEKPDPKYWCKHMRSTVKFAKSIKTLVDNEYKVFVEIGPSKTLAKIVNNEIGDTVTCVSSLSNKVSSWNTILNVLGVLYENGMLIQWNKIQGTLGKLINIPTYKFERSKYLSSCAKSSNENKEHISNPDIVFEDRQSDKSENIEKQEDLLLPFKIVNSKNEQQLKLIEKYLCINIGKLLKCTISEEDTEVNLNYMGFDSLMAVRIKNYIQSDFGFDIPIVKFMEKASIKSLQSTLKEYFSIKKEKQILIHKVQRDNNLFPLSLAQRQLWILQQMDNNTPAYNLPVAMRLKGDINIDNLQKAFDYIIERHEVLRTRYVSIEGKPWQKVVPTEKMIIPTINLCNLTKVKAEEKLKDILAEESQKTFNLEKDFLLRVKLIKIDKNESILLVLLHHIVADGWSLLEILIKELNIIYSALEIGSTPLLEDLPIQYIDYVYWQQNNKNNSKYDDSISYWKEKLSDAKIEPFFPTDYPRPHLTAHKGKRKHYCFSRKLLNELSNFSENRSVTLFTTLLAGFKALLFRWTKEENIIVGTTVANRMVGEIENIIGNFTNHLPLYTFVSPENTFEEFLKKVENTVLGAFTHSECQLESMLEALKVERKDNRNPLYSISFVMHNFTNRSGKMKIGNLEATFFTPLAQIDNHTSEMDMIFELIENKEGLMIDCEFDTEIFNDSTIDNFMLAYNVLLQAVVKKPKCLIKDLPIISEEDKTQIIEKINMSSTQYPVNKCIHEIFEENAISKPNSIALSYEGIEMTYKELNAHSNKLANILMSKGIGKGSLVGICTERSLEMVIAILGVLKAGAAYIALDPNYPKERISYIMMDSDIKFVVAHEETKSYISTVKDDISIIYIDAEEKLDKEDYISVKSNVKTEDLAYVLYTSGSTGKPKGVLIRHRNVTRLLKATEKWFDFGDKDIWTLFHSYAFDFSVWELFGSLLYGGKLVIVPYIISRSPEEFYDLLIKEKVTVLNQTPSAFRQLISVDTQRNDIENMSLRFIVFGGEALDVKMLDSWIERHGTEKPKIINMYGITETTVHVTYKQIVSKYNKGLNGSVGVSIPDLQVYILDSNQEILPLGAVGEICVSGEGVAKGYLKRPELTAEKFIENKFKNKEGKLYCSGDLGRYLENGELQYIGRIDSQVKLRGFRIELGEIDSLLRKHPNVTDSISQIWEPVKDDRRIISYIVLKQKAGKTEDKCIEEDSKKISQWQNVFDETYEQESIGEDPTLNVIGWNSSYTNASIPIQEMHEWVDETVNIIKELRPNNVLELGCGTGMLLFRLAKECQSYVGTDISNVGLEYIKKQMEKPEWKMPQVSLMKKSADDLLDFQRNSFDTVILNSVTQLFPSINYLKRVIENALNLVQSGGKIFIGDIRNYSLMEAYHTSVQLYRSDATDDDSKIRLAIKHAMQEEEELLIAPEFFYALKQSFSRIKRVKISLKRGRYNNEISKFRYDAILYIDDEENQEIKQPRIIDWKADETTIEDFYQMLKEEQPESIIVQNVPNKRLKRDINAIKILKSGEIFKSKDEILKEIELSSNEALDPEDFREISNKLPYSVHVGYSAKGNDYFDVALKYSSKDNSIKAILPEPNADIKPWAKYSNTPSEGNKNRKLIQSLREFAVKFLPEYMVPSTFVVIDKIPLTANGKLDYNSLPKLEQSRDTIRAEYVAPRNAIESMITNFMEEVLGVEHIGVNDAFFELGGNSLLATQLMGRIRSEFSIDLPLRSIFMMPTVSGLSEKVIDILSKEI